ncbi:MAG: hypothetical protein RMM29_00265 [Planctomycetota bacterium]|nr:hypothetical protein [Planctomycetota bacterium]MDW8372068.1 hypothetical protein [Planctomycetota bacterium]
MRWAVALLMLAALSAMERAIIDDPRLALDWLPDRPSQQAWRALFDPHAVWPERDVDLLASAHGERLTTLWAARLWYRGEPWTRREHEPINLRRWRVVDRAVRLAIIRDLRWRRDPRLVAVLLGFLQRESEDVGLVVNALAALSLIDPPAGRQAALRLADPRRPDRLPAAGLPGARSAALALALESGPLDEPLQAALSWALLTADGGERIAALGRLPRGAVPELCGAALQRLLEPAQRGALRDEDLAAGVLICARLEGPLGERVLQALGTLAVAAPRELACAAATALARVVSWRHAIDPQPLLERFQRDPDPSVRHALAAALVRIAPDRLASRREAAAWAVLAAHRLALQDWDWHRP